GRGADRQRRHQPAPSVRNDGDRPRAPDDAAVRPARAGRRCRFGARRTARNSRRDRDGASRSVSKESRLPPRGGPPARSDHRAGADHPVGAARGLGARVRHRLLERRQSHSGAERAARIGARGPRRARRQRGAASLLAESLILCGGGAVLGVLLAQPMVAMLARYASRFSVRALDLTLDASLLWLGAGLAIVAAVLLAFVPRLPSLDYRSGRPERSRR